MTPITNKEKEAIIELLLSPSLPNVQLALEFLANNPAWHPVFKEALEVFYFFDSRRQEGPVVYEFLKPLVEFVTLEGDIQDAHELVGKWLEALEEGFDGPLHPLFWLGSPGLLFREKEEEEEQAEKKQEPSFALPELAFMEQQWSYSPYLDLRPEWWAVAKTWGWFVIYHLMDKETTKNLSSEAIQAYKTIAWQYYQKALPLIKEDAPYFYQAAFCLHYYTSATISQEQRIALTTHYYEKSLSIMGKEEGMHTFLQSYIRFCYEELEDSEKTFELLKGSTTALLPEELAAMKATCQQLGDFDQIYEWIRTILVKNVIDSSTKVGTYLKELHERLVLGEQQEGDWESLEKVKDIIKSLEDIT